MVHQPQTGTTSTTMEKGQQENGEQEQWSFIELVQVLSRGKNFTQQIAGSWCFVVSLLDILCRMYANFVP
jgi:hypothetical protein